VKIVEQKSADRASSDQALGDESFRESNAKEIALVKKMKSPKEVFVSKMQKSPPKLDASHDSESDSDLYMPSCCCPPENKFNGKEVESIQKLELQHQREVLVLKTSDSPPELDSHTDTESDSELYMPCCCPHEDSDKEKGNAEEDRKEAVSSSCCGPSSSCCGPKKQCGIISQEQKEKLLTPIRGPVQHTPIARFLSLSEHSPDMQPLGLMRTECSCACENCHEIRVLLKDRERNRQSEETRFYFASDDEGGVESLLVNSEPRVVWEANEHVDDISPGGEPYRMMGYDNVVDRLKGIQSSIEKCGCGCAGYHYNVEDMLEWLDL